VIARSRTANPARSAERVTVRSLRLRVTVEEWPAARLRYGFVVAEERPETNIEGRELVPGLSADLTRRTLFGRPIAVGGAVELQRRERRGRTFLNAPTFLGLPLESSLIAERSREEFQAASLVTNRSRVTWEQRTRVASNLTLSYAYTFERAHTVDTDPTDTGGLAAEADHIFFAPARDERAGGGLRRADGFLGSGPRGVGAVTAALEVHADFNFVLVLLERGIDN